MAGALGVCVGALSFAFNTRANTKSRQVALFSNVMQTLNSEEGIRKFVEVMSMEWTSFEDFKRKYDSSVNFDSYCKRASLWELGDYIGWQYRAGIVDMNTLYNLGAKKLVFLWEKFKPIIEEYRKWEWSKDQYANWEYLADELSRMQSKRDIDYKRKEQVMISTHIRPQQT